LKNIQARLARLEGGVSRRMYVLYSYSIKSKMGCVMRLGFSCFIAAQSLVSKWPKSQQESAVGPFSASPQDAKIKLCTMRGWAEKNKQIE
jgi:hypothetical protein